MKISLYLLELQNNKYYVGQTDNVDFRYRDHVNGEGAKWTKIHKPVKIILSKQIEIKSIRESLLYENWMTLHFMEKYEWQNVRGGEFIKIEEYKLKEQLKLIFDTENNKIRYYIKNQYLFGSSDYWLIYVLKLENNKYYIGSTKHLGKVLGKHFNGLSINWTKTNKPISVLELIVNKDSNNNYLLLKKSKTKEYSIKYGFKNVLGGQ